MQIHEGNFDEELAASNYSSMYIQPAKFLRKIALAIDDDPAHMQYHLDNPIIQTLANKQFDSCLERVKYVEALSYGDAGALLAAPGAALVGRVLKILGNQDQQDYFSATLNTGLAFTFLAVTEPKKGSDANNMLTSLQKINQEYYLEGKKWLVGHGADGNLGVVLAKASDKFLGMQAILLTEKMMQSAEENGSLIRSHLPQTGLRGARLSQLIFKKMRIPPENLLGLHLSSVQRGLFSILKTFNQMRPSVAAFAIGHAQAMLDSLLTKPRIAKRHAKILKNFSLELNTHRRYLFYAAQQVDKDELQGAEASLAKLKATAIAEKIADYIWLEVEPAAFLDDALLLKWLRDVYGFEYMEGTTQIQLKNMHQAYFSQAI